MKNYIFFPDAVEDWYLKIKTEKITIDTWKDTLVYLDILKTSNGMSIKSCRMSEYSPILDCDQITRPKKTTTTKTHTPTNLNWGVSVNVLKFDYEIKKYALAHNQQFETKSPNRMKEHSGFKRFFVGIIL